MFSEKDGLLMKQEQTQVWQRYCGFLDLSLASFLEIQEQLLLEQIDLMADSPLGAKFLGERLPSSALEFRQQVPLTTYDDYLPYLDKGNDAALPEKPCLWAHTTRNSEGFKWVPYTRRAYELLQDYVVAIFLLACASHKGDIRVKEGDRVLYNVPARPYLSGWVTHTMTERLALKPLLPFDEAEDMDFKKKVEEGFKLALLDGVDILGCMSSVLMKMGENFAHRSRGLRLSRDLLRPRLLFRMLQAIVQAKLKRRRILPKDLWPVKALICWGEDGNLYRDKITQYWGRKPYEFYACTEASVLAMQSWRKEGMTFLPYSTFLEFITEEDWLRSRQDRNYQPPTLLLDEVEAGKRYEVVITSFHGMPFLRYRVGHIIKVLSLTDEEAGITLPRISFETRADDLIDLAGFTRLEERAVIQSLEKARVEYEDWSLRKEYNCDRPLLHLYLEPTNGFSPEEVQAALHESLKQNDRFYADLDEMLEMQPLVITHLSKGTFRRYYEEKRREGRELHLCRPRHMNPTDSEIKDLLRLSNGHSS